MNDKQELTKYLNLIIKVGVGVLSSILFGFAAGFFLDSKFQLRGIGIFLGVIAGVILGFFWIYKEVIKIEDNNG